VISYSLWRFASYRRSPRHAHARHRRQRSRTAVREPERVRPGYAGRRRLLRRIEDGHALILAVVEDLTSGDVLVVSAVRTTDFKRYWKEDKDD
jgi:hypothetical protein